MADMAASVLARLKNNVEVDEVANTLQNKSYYISLFTKNTIEKESLKKIVMETTF